MHVSHILNFWALVASVSQAVAIPPPPFGIISAHDAEVVFDLATVNGSRHMAQGVQGIHGNINM
ncbi:hypothetical protein EUX98_g2242 [Antrodiella citrinella]|uniref:Uncharacterized protein n=1 Tax=Antrodiella citrinella TaxID=2447956 RepID=A0A4S4N2F2_9APHY|nr:hypothetical protein EUX98_g2242 [Antrodiella citrinella]